MQFSLTLAVADLELTEAFYREILLLSPQRNRSRSAPNDFLLLRCEETSIVFRQLAELQARHPALLQHLDRHPLGTGMQLEFRYDGLDPVRRNLARHRWPINYELEDDEHRRRELWLHDPDGYLLVLNEEHF